MSTVPRARPALPPRPPWADAALVLADGALFWGRGLGATGRALGEVCFNTSLTGYQEILTDPSYAGQIITFTFPHIGNVGVNPQDDEAQRPAARGLILRADVSQPSNWRAAAPLQGWLVERGLVGITGVDTRALTRRLRDQGAVTGLVVHDPDAVRAGLDLHALLAETRAWPGLEGMDLAKEVTCAEPYRWQGGRWSWAGDGAPAPRFDVVAVDFGAKRNILRCLSSAGCRVTVVPATATSEQILACEPQGIFLSNGPGDPAATAEYFGPQLQALLRAGLPIFGICLGHQLLGLALGGRTAKMHHGHRGGNHPVLDLQTGKVEITSQNHGFEVKEDSLPPGVVASHRSLFDGTLEGLRVEGRPVFSVQYHPEASPGPHDSHPLFERFVSFMAEHAQA